MNTDPVALIQNASVIASWGSIIIGLVIVLTNIAAIFFAVRISQKKHSKEDGDMLQHFEAVVLQRITAVEAGSISKEMWNEHRKENDASVRRVHEKIEKEERQINVCMNSIKKAVGEINGIVLGLKGAFDEHKVIPHKV